MTEEEVLALEAEFSPWMQQSRAAVDHQSPAPTDVLELAVRRFQAQEEPASPTGWWEQLRHLFLVPALAGALVLFAVPHGPRPADPMAWENWQLDAQLDGAYSQLEAWETNFQDPAAASHPASDLDRELATLEAWIEPEMEDTEDTEDELSPALRTLEKDLGSLFESLQRL